MARKKKNELTLRDAIVASLGNTQSDRLAVLIPEIIKGDFSAQDYKALVPLKPRDQWPDPHELSVTYGETLGLIYQSQASLGHAEFVHSFTKGVATIALLLGTQGQALLTQALSDPVQGIIDPMLMGDGELPPIAPWLREDALTSAKLIIEFADIGNLRDMLSWSYGIWWAVVIVVGPNMDDTSQEVLAYIRAVVDHFGHLGVPPV